MNRVCCGPGVFLFNKIHKINNTLSPEAKNFWAFYFKNKLVIASTLTSPLDLYSTREAISAFCFQRLWVTPHYDKLLIKRLQDSLLYSNKSQEDINMLKGEKVILRPVKRSDISFFLKWFNDPEVTQYLVMYLPMTEMAEEKWIEEQGMISTPRSGNNVNNIIFVIEAREDGTNNPIGSCGLHAINQKDQLAEFGIAIGDKDYWSKGYGTEAAWLLINYGFLQLNLHRISSNVLYFNERSIKLHKKVGFQEEGRLRKAVFKNGRFCDQVMFGILREEWEE
jgi:RimJ/RimL family protein N-acetyltransferase